MTSVLDLYLLAGNGSAAEWWDDARPHFRAYRPRPLELPGFGANPAPALDSLDAYAQALLAATEPGQAILACGVNALLVLHALRHRPGHFSRVILLSPVGTRLATRRLPALMRSTAFRRLTWWMLAHCPRLVFGRIALTRWTPAQYARMGLGYARCRAFLPYWDLVTADTALPGLDAVTGRVDLFWGAQDKVLKAEQAGDWPAALPGAQVQVQVVAQWGHYPWIDDPAGFAETVEGVLAG